MNNELEKYGFVFNTSNIINTSFESQSEISSLEDFQIAHNYDEISDATYSSTNNQFSS